MITTKLDGKKVKLFKFQELLAQHIAKKLVHNDSVTFVIPCGHGKRVIMQRVADLLKDPSKLY